MPNHADQSEYEMSWRKPWPFWRPFCWFTSHDWYVLDWPYSRSDRQCKRCGVYQREIDE